MARKNDEVLPLACNALACALEGQTPVDAAGYCEGAEHNLIPTVGPGVWRRVKGDLAAGKGSELDHKFRAAFSSSALAVNTFAPLVDEVDLADGLRFRGDIRFEQERSAWARGYRPTLDAVVEPSGAPLRLFVESKCIEFLREGHPDFSQAFVRHAKEHLSAAAVRTFKELAEDPFAFDPVDGRQLAKHFLAARRSVEDAGSSCKVTLLCIVWEPADASRHEVFARHRQQLHKLAVALSDPDVSLVPMTYRQLWEHWEASGDLTLRRHTHLLRERYDVSIQRYS